MRRVEIADGQGIAHTSATLAVQQSTIRPVSAGPASHSEGVRLIQSVLSPGGAPVLGLYIHTAAGYLARSIATVKEFRKVEPYLLGTPAILSVRPGISQTELSRYLGGGRAKAGLQVAKCIRLGWVERIVAVGDRRKYTLHLTRLGSRVLAEIVPVIAVHERELAKKLSVAERGQLMGLLGKLMKP